MKRLILKFLLYYLALSLFLLVELLPSATYQSLLIVAAVLALVNTLIRPLLTIIALPFNLFTFGIASIFANLLTIVIANAIAGAILSSGFWVLLLIAFTVMIIDDWVALARHSIKKLKLKF